MSARIEEFGDSHIVVVTFTDPDRLAAYREHLALPFPVVTDVGRELYRSLGIERGTRRQVWSPSAAQLYIRLLRNGRRLQRSDEDVRQLGADVVVDASGRIRKIFRPAGPASRPTVEELLTALPSGR